MKQFFAGLFVGICILAIVFFFLDGIDRTQAIREASITPELRPCAGAPTGAHCKIGRAELVVITARRK